MNARPSHGHIKLRVCSFDCSPIDSSFAMQRLGFDVYRLSSWEFRLFGCRAEASCACSSRLYCIDALQCFSLRLIHTQTIAGFIDLNLLEES